ncbi:MAG: endonuclease [Cytophagales bacterium]|nr:endonuclease [Armatimonadota bacterium]
MTSLTPETLTQIVLVLGVLCLLLAVILALLLRRLRRLSILLSDTEFQNRSLSSTYGRITEQWFPLMDSYPYDPQGFRFLGSPIDGVQFEEDRIVFVEFKANKSRLSPNEKRLKRLVEEGYVYWEEFHFTDLAEKDKSAQPGD